ncbi:hypothetical protein [Brachybacterium paraconglomeratum]|uniref:hypothetical protein n=1 Tax=Brachybacterium paraconglomeratum TaxID=173362 RepID=UPI0031E9F6DD
MNTTSKAQLLEDRADALDARATESEALALYEMNPAGSAYWNVMERAENNRTQARDLRHQARALRRRRRQTHDEGDQ